jgi:hypothetical protein
MCDRREMNFFSRDGSIQIIQIRQAKEQLISIAFISPSLLRFYRFGDFRIVRCHERHLLVHVLAVGNLQIYSI